ncbi:MAG: helix-turn-helix transcriptional regulator [Rudaea sp.]|nr:helix-turn-helix transcriptional regulator [Rudaea sp.]
MNTFKTNVAKAFGAALREARTRAKLSQEDLGLESGVDRTFVSMLERGVRQPALSTVFALCDAMAIKPGQLVDRVALLRKRIG